ncbi:Glycosyltransferase, GT2 family [Curtobacterium sp. UNCCL20]|uniref:glycosyltransferase family 2 protein n=1 Tax=Curtobacterium sp. UNCCL20 TaxID=1502773 RepID=UPI00088CC281|nr:glycosyltransferase family 2 protein [Curtobacterium sp. UNCCL20]SDR05544.1 Glycosyltransferase, GT2 family [Curtobacterium sp. UNCCL20]
MTRSTLVVVPVYGDLESLLRCADGLLEHLDADRHRALFVNDCGPDADTIERALLERIGDRPGFRYERNESNLGFVGTCNRAVTELDTGAEGTGAEAVLLLNSDAVPTAGFLDAMLAVLDEERTGVVTARSDNATIASIPYRLTNRGAARTEARTRQVWGEIAPLLPVSQVMPVAMGFCFLTRRELITEHGLFDEAFAPGYGEENDYCLRIAAHGWLAKIANRALVLHAGGKSFSGNRNALRAAHQRELERRYPFLPDAVAAYQRHGMTATERFADVLVPAGPAARLAVDLRHAPDADGLVREIDAAFGDGFALEARLPSGTSAPAAWTVTTDDPDPDDLVTATILVDPTPADLVLANRRAAHWVIVRTEPTTGPWSSAAHRAGADRVAELARPFAEQVTADELESAREVVENSMLAGPSGNAAALERRWAAILPLDLAAAEAGSTASSGEVTRLRRELDDLRASRSFRTGQAIAKVASRLPGRR